MLKKPVFPSDHQMMQKIESLFLAALIALNPPIVLLLAGWWGSLVFVPETQVKYFALAGLLTGISLDIVFLKKWRSSALQSAFVWPVLALLFYHLGLFGFFMGVPVFNFALGPIWGYYMGLRLRTRKPDDHDLKHASHNAALLSAFMMAAACAASLLLAYLDSYLSENISGMFALAHLVDKNLVLILSACAGIILIAGQYYLTRAVMLWAAGSFIN